MSWVGLGWVWLGRDFSVFDGLVDLMDFTMDFKVDYKLEGE